MSTIAKTVEEPKLLNTFPNMLSEFVYKRTYAKWNGERRENWTETVDRYVEFLKEECPQTPEHIFAAIREYMVGMQVMGSMRALWSAGSPARRDNTCIYNCSFIPLDNLKAFSEGLYILMQGTGVGFSVESQFVNNLPEVASFDGTEIEHVIPDSAEGWADALYLALVEGFKGNKVAFDYSLVRKAGAVLKTKGGRASGPEPLKNLLDYVQELLMGAQGRKLKPIECHDIMCKVGEIVVSGGVRRSALISFSDPEDEEMRHAKNWKRGEFPQHRYMANNSAYYQEKPSPEVFWADWEALVESMSGERGFSIGNWHTRADRPTTDVRSNPCHEIGLRFLRATDPITGEGGSGQFCNLSAAVMRADDTVESFAKKVELATWIGAMQATFTHFPYLRKGWVQTCQEDRLLGVDITGQCDNPALSQNEEAMRYFNQVAIETAREASKILEINMPAAITCGKPSGNTSQFVDCASGFHPRYSKFYFRHVRIAAHDPLCKMVRDAGLPMFKETGEENKADDDVSIWVARFPVKSPEGAMLREDETALEQCERYLQVMNTWCSEKGHNQSCTIYPKEDEWQAVGEWVYENFDKITGVSFLPYDGGKYRLAPYEEIDQATYEEAMGKMPEIDFGLLSVYEKEDRGEGSRELACTGGACEL